jgi:DNA-binding transcriptional ArsR family regulator
MDTQESRQLDQVFGALAHPIRRSILDEVSKGGSTVVELAAPHAISLNAVSKHIKHLERAGLVHRQIDGSYHRITINKRPINGAAIWLSHYVPFWGDALQNLKTYVEST